MVVDDKELAVKIKQHIDYPDCDNIKYDLIVRKLKTPSERINSHKFEAKIAGEIVGMELCDLVRLGEMINKALEVITKERKG